MSSPVSPGAAAGSALVPLQVPAAFQMLEGRLNTLSANVRTIQNRLAPVLRPEEGGLRDPEKAPSIFSAPIAIGIADADSVALHLVRVTEDILARLEIG